MTTTPSSYSSQGRTFKPRRNSIKCKLNMDRENIPPKSDVWPNFGIHVGKNFAGPRRSESYLEEKILSPISSQSKRINYDDPSEGIPPKKMRSEMGMKLFETSIAEADEFETIGGKMSVDGCQMELSRSFCSKLNYCDFEIRESRTEISNYLLENFEARQSRTETNKSIPENFESPESRTETSKFLLENFKTTESRTEIHQSLFDSFTTTQSKPEPTPSIFGFPENETSFQSPLGFSNSSLAKIEDHYLNEDEVDASKLPLVRGRRHDCKSISPETLKRVIQGSYDNLFEEYVIIDCRYPYEYNGGHVKNAINVFTKEAISSIFMYDKIQIKRKAALIFHCEFSSERGPRLMQHLRSIDRQANLDTYPSLFYPEVYLLDGGYKSFFENCPSLCVPMTYKPMLHVDHAHELRHFKSKSKSWAPGEKKSCPSRVTKMKGIKASRRRCIVGEAPMDVDDSDQKIIGTKDGVVRTKKTPRVLFRSYHSETSRQELMESYEFENNIGGDGD